MNSKGGWSGRLSRMLREGREGLSPQPAKNPEHAPDARVQGWRLFPALHDRLSMNVRWCRALRLKIRQCKVSVQFAPSSASG